MEMGQVLALRSENNRQKTQAEREARTRSLVVADL